MLKKGAPDSIVASAGKARVKAFDLDPAKTKTTTDGLDTNVGPSSLSSPPSGAAAIRTVLGVKLPKGYGLGSATVKLQTAATRVTLDAGTAGVLTQLGVSVAPEGDAKAGSTIQFPVTNAGGKISLTAPITHSGGLTFTAGGKTLTVGDFTIDPTAGILFAERTPVGRLPLFQGRPVGRDHRDPGHPGGAQRRQAQPHLAAAGALNSTFGVTAFTENLTIAPRRSSRWPSQQRTKRRQPLGPTRAGAERRAGRNAATCRRTHHSWCVPPAHLVVTLLWRPRTA